MATKFSKSATILSGRGLMKKGGSTKALKKAGTGMNVKSTKPAADSAATTKPVVKSNKPTNIYDKSGKQIYMTRTGAKTTEPTTTYKKKGGAMPKAMYGKMMKKGGMVKSKKK